MIGGFFVQDPGRLVDFIVFQPRVVNFNVPGAQGLESGLYGWREEYVNNDHGDKDEDKELLEHLIDTEMVLQEVLNMG